MCLIMKVFVFSAVHLWGHDSETHLHTFVCNVEAVTHGGGSSPTLQRSAPQSILASLQSSCNPGGSLSIRSDHTDAVLMKHVHFINVNLIYSA